MLDGRSLGHLRRLTRWLEEFRGCFGHPAQLVSLRAYVPGLFNDSRRKSMRAMLSRLTEPVHYQALQHFITNAPWDAGRVWRRLLELLPERSGTLILDDTGFPKQGDNSPGVARQYSGTLGKIANCQIAVTAALWTGLRAYLVGAELYLPKQWLTDKRRTQARIPRQRKFEEKWRLALTLVRRARAAGLRLEAVIADSFYGDVTAFRTGLERLRLSYVVGVSSHLAVYRGSPTVASPTRPGRGRPRKRPLLAAGQKPLSVRRLASHLPDRAWSRLSWRNGKNRPWRGEFVALRVTPVSDLRRQNRLTELWLLCERPVGGQRATKFYFSNLPPATTLRKLVKLARQRWAIEQQYRELKTELGLDHFEGRTYAGWNHHVVLTAAAHAFIQTQRAKNRHAAMMTFPVVRAIVQEIFTGLLFVCHPKWIDVALKAKEIMQLRI